MCAMISVLRRYTRRKRGLLFRKFLQSFPRPLKVIDLGGTVRYWEALGVTDSDGLDITLANNHAMDRTNAHQINPHRFIHEWDIDALKLASMDLATFDVIASNSFIEHLAGQDDQRLVAQQIIAADRPYFIQTPNRNSPIDPHFPHPYVPFFALYPKRLKARLLTIGGLGGGWRAPSLDAALGALTFYNPLGLREMRELFPGAELHIERPLGVPMSIIAMRHRTF